MYPNIQQNWSAAVQAELRGSIIQTKSQKARTLGTHTSGPGARNESGSMVGLEIPFKKGVPHGEVALDPIRGVTSFNRFNAPGTKKMFVGLTYQGFTVEFEHFHEKDRKMPENRYDMRDQMMLTYMQHMNWYIQGPGDGTITIVATGGGSGTITFTNDNTGFGRTKGSLRLAITDNSANSDQWILYQSYTRATDTLTATFYVTARPSVLTATVVITDGGTILDGDTIVKEGHYKKVPYGHEYLINYTTRDFQGVSTGTFTEFNARRVNGNGGDLTPTLMDTAKGSAQTRGNSIELKRKRICHMTPGNYKRLGAFGYDLRVYNAEKGDANTTFALPDVFEDEDLIFPLDADYDDACLRIRQRKSFFVYRMREMEKITRDGGEQYPGQKLVGSTEFYENYCESWNLAWDARGEDGKNTGEGNPNTAVVIDNFTLPEISQINEGQFLV